MKRVLICLLTILPVVIVLGVVSAEFSSHHSDEFGDSASLSDWTQLASNTTTATTIDIDTSEADKLVIVPTNFHNNGWYASSIGPYLYKMIEGDFVATSHVIAGNVNDHDAPPTGTYNSAGFVVRDPASDSQSAQNWIMYNHGYQVHNGGAGHGYATEAKTTVNSTSILTLRPTASDSSNSGQLTVCRSGDTFYLFKWLDDEGGWLLEETIPRPDFPETVQFGLVVNAWTDANLRAQFDYLRVYTGTVASSADCLTQLTTPTSVTVVEKSAETPINPALLLSVLLAAIGVTFTTHQHISKRYSQSRTFSELGS